ncbi:MBL fold metallo-hydrolase [Micrococcus luteus]|uniref:MBL fold metallo-hydrolase n=1 Tax=Micrococcus luteus TaxID=1270 RepID=UPI00366A5D5B
MSTTLTLFGHSAVRLEKAGRRLAFDPGAFSDAAVLDGADAVLVTHGHPDHVVPEQLARALAGTGTHVWAPRDLTGPLAEAGLDAGHVHTAVPGETFEAAGFRVEVLGGEHAVIHAEVPRPVNVSYLVDGAVLHPGDSFTVPDADVEVLLLPAAAPWLRIADVVDQMRAIAATHTRPIHDGILSEDGKGVVDGVLSGLAEGVTDYRRLAPGEPWTF